MCRCFCSGCSEEVLSAVFQVFAHVALCPAAHTCLRQTDPGFPQSHGANDIGDFSITSGWPYQYAALQAIC